MKARVAFLLLATAFAAAGCSDFGTSAAPPRPQAAADSASHTVPVVEAMVARLPAGTHVYVTDSIAVHAGDEVAVFPASSRVTRSADKLTIVDASSGETFIFPANATIAQAPGGGRAYVQPRQAVPAWVSESNGRLAGIR